MMKQFLKSYDVMLKVIGPVFIGSGREIGKKEYVFLSDTNVGVLNVERFYMQLKEADRSRFESFMMRPGQVTLTDWLKDNRLFADARKCMKYTLAKEDEKIEDSRNFQIMEFMKDPYGQPYVPGSSLKGMLRTILLGAALVEKPDSFGNQGQDLRRSLGESARREYYLRDNIQRIEAKEFRTLKRPETKPMDAVNDCMSGFIVSDSRPLHTGDLVLCQKCDMDVEGNVHDLPLFRECLRPGTEIHFTLTIDSSVCRFTQDTIMNAVAVFNQQYYQNFSEGFRRMQGKSYPENTVFLGGGCGFLSKTVVYPMFGYEEGLPAAQTIFDKTISGKQKEQHGHAQDRYKGVSPHIFKCTRYHGQTYEMSRCRMTMTEIV